MIGAGDLREVLDRRDQLQQRGDEGDEAADRRLPSRPLCQSAATITAASAHDASTCVNGVIVAAAITALIESRRSRSLTLAEALRLRRAGGVQAHAAPGEHVLLDDVGEVVGRLLRLDGEAMQAPAVVAHDERDRRQQDRDERGSAAS